MARNKVNAAGQHSKQHDNGDYVYTVVWSAEDEVFIGRVLEFPSLGVHGSTQAKALSEIRSVVQHAFEDLQDGGEEVPEPLNKRKVNER